MKTGTKFVETGVDEEDIVLKPTVRYNLIMEIPSRDVSIGDSPRSGYKQLEISVPYAGGLDLKSVREQLQERGYANRKIDDILEAIMDAVDDEIIPMVLRQYVVRPSH